ncbi:Crp/Fnr family transcriptional regulator [soil metagenome]
MGKTATPKNRLLSALPKAEFNTLAPKLERVPLVFNENIYVPGQVIRHVCFPDSGIISLLSRVNGKSLIEVGIVGNEGMVGLPVFLGVKTSANVAVVQGSGTASRLAVEDFLESCTAGNKMPVVIQHFIHSLFTQVSQSAACNRFHHIEERLARWLLMTGDRMHSNKFRITQEFLSNMLGVRREGVSKAAGSLSQKDLISYVRGDMTINDRAGLEKAACECYCIIKKEYDIAKN